MCVSVICCADGLTKPDYAKVEAKLKPLEMYEPVLLNEFAPEDCFRR